MLMKWIMRSRRACRSGGRVDRLKELLERDEFNSKKVINDNGSGVEVEGGGTRGTT